MQLQETVGVLHPKMGRLSTKLQYLISSTQSRVLYVAQIASFSAAQHSQIDCYFRMLIRSYKHTANLVSHALIHNPDLGGYIRNTGAAVQKRKEAILHRMMLEGGNTQKAMDGLLLRQVRAQTTQDPTISQTTLSFHRPSDRTYWASALLPPPSEALPGYTATLQYTGAFNSTALPLSAIPTFPPLLQTLLGMLGVLHEDELLDMNATSAKPLPWIAKPIPQMGDQGYQLHTYLTRLWSERAIPEANHLQLLPTRGMTLLLSPHGLYPQGLIAQLRGWHIPGHWHVTAWIPPLKPGQPLLPLPGCHNNGAGSSITLTHATLYRFTIGRAFLMENGAANSFEHYLRGSNPSFHISKPPYPLHTMHQQIPYLLPNLDNRTLPPWLLTMIDESDLETYPARFMVGAASSTTKPVAPHRLFYAAEPDRVNRAIILIGDSTYRPRINSPALQISINDIPSHYSLRQVETLVLLTTLMLKSHFQHTTHPLTTSLKMDWACKQGLTRQYRTYIPRTIRTSRDDQLSLAAQIWSLHQTTPIHDSSENLHFPASPGQKPKRKPKSHWNSNQLLQWSANQIASHRPEPHRDLELLHLLPLQQLHVPFSTVINQLQLQGYWHWTSQDPLKFYNTFIQRQGVIKIYLGLREKRTIHDIDWTEVMLGLLLPSLRKHPYWKHPHNRAELLRLLWDYIPHGRNIAKFDGDKEIPPCPLCHTDRDDIHHYLNICQDKDIVAHRETAYQDILQIIQDNEHRPEAATQYLRTLLTHLKTQDETRQTQGFWLLRPFKPNLLLLENSDQTRNMKANALDAVKYSMPHILIKLFMTTQRIWRTRNALIPHPPRHKLPTNVPQQQLIMAPHLLRNRPQHQLPPMYICSSSQSFEPSEPDLPPVSGEHHPPPSKLPPSQTPHFPSFSNTSFSQANQPERIQYPSPNSEPTTHHPAHSGTDTAPTQLDMELAKSPTAPQAECTNKSSLADRLELELFIYSLSEHISPSSLPDGEC